MILHTCTLTLAPGPASALRGFLAEKFTEYTARHRDESENFIHRYAAVQCKDIEGKTVVIGIREGAQFLEETFAGKEGILVGGTQWKMEGPAVIAREGSFGPSEKMHSYEFVTPWLALNQENSRKFYLLRGKPERDTFIRKILVAHIETLAKSLGCDVPDPIKCEVNLHFQKERVGKENLIVFTGKFQAGFVIPDYLGIGQSVSQGFGTVRRRVDG